MSVAVDRGTTGDTGFNDKRITQTTAAHVTTGDYRDTTAIIAKLQDGSTGDSTTYTNAYIAKMTKNDMVYAERLLYDAAGIK